MQANRQMTQVEQEMALLYRKYAPSMLIYVRMRVPSPEDAEDLVVEVFMAALEQAKFAELSEKAKQLWLWRVTRNKVIDTYRRAKTRQSVILDHVAEGLFEDEMFSPEYSALRQEDYVDLYAHLQSLPRLQQQILRMRFGQDLSCREIATRLGKQENVVRVTLSRSLNLLRKIYRRRKEEQESVKELPMQNPQTQYSNIGRPPGSHPRRTSLMRRLSILAAAVFLLALVGSMALVFYAVRHNNGGSASPHPTATLSTAHVPLKVTSVSMSVTPESIANFSCGTNVTVTYTALFHVRPNSAGGTVQFEYTVNNGRGQTPASITFNPGETTKSYTFTWSGALPLDHTYPEPGGVQVTSPNQLTSPLVAPTGQCTSGKFQVTNID